MREIASQNTALPSKNSGKLRIVEALPMRKHVRVPALGALLLTCSAASERAMAQPGIITGGISGCDFTTGWLSSACIPMFIGHLITFVFSFVGTFFVINVMYAGYELALGYMGEGDKGKGKERLKWSIAGLIVATCTFLILDLVLYVVLGS